MAEIKYLYGAAVQGIQGFIFQTNKLKEIVGASELVELICTTAFDEFAGKGMSVVRAAGNIKHLFESVDECRQAALHFPKKVMLMAPGITLSQAVVKMEGEYSDFEKAVNELERRLRIQRNRPVRSTTLGLIGIKRAQRTGLPLLALGEMEAEVLKVDALDAATKAKLSILVNIEKENLTEHTSSKIVKKKDVTFKLSEKSFGIDFIKKDRIAYDIDRMTGQNDWISILHIDGNGLGQIVSKIGKDSVSLNVFSSRLDEVTMWSARYAFAQMLGMGKFGKLAEKDGLDELSIDHIGSFKEATDLISKFIGQYKIEEVIPIRPLILSGDDLTLICRGDIAVDYAQAFMTAFEKLTQLHLGDILNNNNCPVFATCSDGTPVNYLTACAGIVFVKSSFPFYYGYNLAEELCGVAKKDAKQKIRRIGNPECDEQDMLPRSCMAFHKVQDSFTERYELIAERELKRGKSISFVFGPYYLKGSQSDRWTIQELKDNTNILCSDDAKASRSHLRVWMSLLYNNVNTATQRIKGLEKMISSKEIKTFIQNITDLKKDGRSPVYDMLVLDTILNQQTNEDKQ